MPSNNHPFSRRSILAQNIRIYLLLCAFHTNKSHYMRLFYIICKAKRRLTLFIQKRQVRKDATFGLYIYIYIYTYLLGLLNRDATVCGEPLFWVIVRKYAISRLHHILATDLAQCLRNCSRTCDKCAYNL